MTQYTTLSRTDLLAFDAESRDHILTAMDVGCTGRVSSKGHAVLRNAAGGTEAIARLMTAPNRTSQNTRAKVRKFLAEHAEALAAPAPSEHTATPGQTQHLSLAAQKVMNLAVSAA